MSWGGSLQRLTFLLGVLTGLACFETGGDARAQDSIAVLQYTEGDLKRAAAAVESELKSTLDLGRIAQENVPELVIPLDSASDPKSDFQGVLDYLETSSKQKVRLAARVPQGGIRIQAPPPGIQIRHPQGAPQMEVQLQSLPAEAQIRGIQVGYLVTDAEGKDQFIPLPAGSGSENQSIPSADLDIKIHQAKVLAQFDLPESGTAVRLSSLKPEVLPESLSVDLKLPQTLQLQLKQAESGKVTVELNEFAMGLIESQAEQKTREAILAKVNELSSQRQEDLRALVQQKIDGVRGNFSVSRQLRLPLEGESAKALQATISSIESRNLKKSPVVSIDTDSAQNAKSQGLAILDELTQTFQLASPEKFELVALGKEKKEGPLYLSTRLGLLHAFLANVTHDWDHFIKLSGLDPKNKKDQEAIRSLRNWKEDLLDHLTSRKSHDELARFLEKWGRDSGSSDHHMMNLWLQKMSPAIRKFIENGGLNRAGLIEANGRVHDILVQSRLQKTAILMIDESATRLRDQVIAISGTLNTLHSKLPMPIPGCRAEDLTGKPQEGLQVSSSLRAVNQLAQRMHQDGTLGLMLSKQAGLKLLEPPHISPGRRNKDAKPPSPPVGLKDGIFTLKAKIDKDGDEFEVEIVGRLAPENGGKAMSLSILEIESLHHNAGFLETIFPVTLLFKVLPIALFGQSFVEGKLEEKIAKGENKLIFDLPEKMTQAGFLIHGFEIDPQNLDQFSAKIGPSPIGAQPE